MRKYTTRPIPINPDLNVIIGGKSSGKSLLLYHIACTIDPKQTIERLVEGITDDNIKIKAKKEVSDKYKLGSNEFKVKWADGSEQSFSKRNEEGVKRKILYIPQNYIQVLSEPKERKSSRELGEFIREILLQKSAANVDYQKFLEEVRRLDTIRENLVSEYFASLLAYEKYNREIKDTGDKDGVRNYIKDLKERISELQKKSNIEDDELREYESLTQQSKDLHTEKANLDSDIDKVKLFQGRIEEISTTLSLRRENTANELINKDVKNKFLNLTEFLENLSSISNKLFEKLIREDGGLIPDKISNAQTLSNEIEIKLKPMLAKFEEKELIENLREQIKREEEKLNIIIKREVEVKKKHEEKTTIRKKIFEEYDNTYQQYLDIVEKLNLRGQEVATDLKLMGYTKFYYSRFKAKIFDEYINNVSSKEATKDLDIYRAETLQEVDYSQHKSDVETLFDKIINEDGITLKKHKNKKDCINALLKDEFFDYWEVEYKNDKISDGMSPGKANLVLLKLIIELSESKSPILIDQPEDNLDNRSIFTDLVTYLREKKIDRQMIIVTHNPNIVVGADADNVIVANQRGQDEKRENEEYQFDYITGPLECTMAIDENIPNVLESMGTREHVTEVLEGGEEAFKKREEKYGFE